MEISETKPVIIQADEGRKFAVLGHQISLKLACDDTAGDYYVFEASSPPGLGVPPHEHEHEDEIIRIMDGELEVFLDGKTFRALPGAVIFFPRGVPHGFRNVAETPARTLFVVSPASNFERFFVDLSALPADQPPDFAKVAEIFEHYDIHLLTQPSSS